MADVFQRLIIQAFTADEPHHPINEMLSPPVLQYADSTLILLKATPTAAQTLRKILNDFAATTGLQINFHKTTFVPMHTSGDLAGQLTYDLGMPTASSPRPTSASPSPLTNYFLQPSNHWLITLIDTCLVGGPFCSPKVAG